MDDILFLAHRIPFPPEKGDKIRSFHILNHLAARYRVHLGCFFDDPADRRHVDELRRICTTVLCRPLRRSLARVRSLTGLPTGLSLSQMYFHDGRLERWVADTMRQRQPKRIFVFGSAMAPYAMLYRRAKRVLDMVDVDSEKWGAYSRTRAWPMSWLYARERDRLLDLERRAATEFDWTLLVSHPEAALLQRLVPEAAERVVALRNGVDTTYFNQCMNYPMPFPRSVMPIVFTGAMDYWPNIQAVEWFARSVMPIIRDWNSRPEFWIVGANPTRSVRRLGCVSGVHVTGRVEDIRPYLAHAGAVVAPLQIAQGVQNKVLEAMAMAKPVVATPQASTGIVGSRDNEIIVRETAADFAQGLELALSDEGARIGRRARTLMETRFQWRETWAVLDRLFATGDTADHEVDRARGEFRPGLPASVVKG